MDYKRLVKIADGVDSLDREYVEAYQRKDVRAAERLLMSRAKSAGYDKLVYRVDNVGGTEYRDVAAGVYYAEKLAYFDYSVTRYDRKSAKRYVLDLSSFWSPMDDMELIINVWSDILGKASDFEKYDIEDEAWEGRGEWEGEELCQTSTDGLAYAGRQLGYSGTILKDIPQTDAPVGGEWEFTEYAVYNSNVVKVLGFTFDDGGELIPLSQRFDKEKFDIRY